MRHIDPGDLVDLARGVAGPLHAPAYSTHLATCERCRMALDRLRFVVRAASAGAPLPVDVLRRATELASVQDAPASVIQARIVFDNLVEPLTPGLRGEIPDHHLLFEADSWAVDLRLVRGDGTLSVTGQLASAVAPSRDCAGVPVLARHGEAVVGRSLTGRWGEFTLGCADVSPLSLDILVAPPTITVRVPPARP